MTDAETVIARVLGEHYEVAISLGTPRQYTRYGGWSMSCSCGCPIGDQGDEDEAYAAHRAHVAAEIARALRDAALLPEPTASDQEAAE